MIPILDTLRSLATGLGTSKDKKVTQGFVLRQITQPELNAMHRSDWLARKIVDIIPNDMTREWRDWQAKKSQIEDIEAVEKAPLINLRAKVAAALQKARLFGGSVIYLGMADGQPAEELVPERVGKGDLRYLHVLHRHEVTVGEIIRDVMSPWLGQPEYYEVTGQDGTRVRVHPSRVIRFIGADVLDGQSQATDGWGDSILQVVYDAVQNAGSAQAHVASLIPEAKTDVIYVPGLSKALQNQTTTQQLTERFTYANTIKSMFNMVLLEGNGASGDQAQGEKWEQKQINFAQLPELMRQFLQVASGAADIPVTRLLGESPAGLNSTGESDMRNYYDHIGARQRVELSPAMHILDEVLIRSALGSRDEAIYYEWSPLWSMTEKEKAEVFKSKSDAARALAGNGQSPALLPIEALSDALVNTLTEDGSLPGLEQAVEQYGKLSEQEESEEEAAAALPAPANRNEQTRIAANDAEPRTLYVRRDVLNAAAIIAHFKEQGFETTLPADDMHVTITFSRKPVDWMKMGENWSGDEKGRITINAGGPRMMDRFGQAGEATVLLFASSTLSWRHEDMVRQGATWDHPEYQPHITISYGSANLDLSKVEPYRGEIVLGPEVFEEVKEDWKNGINET